MKILKIVFENLNSLAGRWEIDFEDSNFTDAGIFAITGPTGAGKSTILDAICLALYGRSPRLESISQSTNEIMSKGSSRCGAEVLFEAGSNRYICSWSQRRARDAINGRLQNQRHEIAIAKPDGTAELISNRIDEVKTQIAELTGMDFTRFTRSMLLAQGGFAAFLNAPPDEKAPILEQITGTELYSEISKKVHEIHKREEASLISLRSQVATEENELLSEEDVEKVEVDQAAARAQITKLRVERNTHQIAAENLRAIARHRTEIEKLKVEQARHLEEVTSFKGQDTRLEAAKRALRVANLYFNLENLKKAQRSEATNLATTQTNLEDSTISHDQIAAAFEAAKEELSEATAELRQLNVVTTRVREIDSKSLDVKDRISQIDAEFEETSAASLKYSQDLSSARDKLSKAISAKGELEGYLEANLQDQGLQSELSVIRVTYANLSKAKENLEGAIERRVTSLRRLEATSADVNAATAQLRDGMGIIEQLRQLAEASQTSLLATLEGRSRREIEEERDALRTEIVRIGTIEDLKGRRGHLLVAGQACPLCGSIEHPFANGEASPSIDLASTKLNEIDELIASIDRVSEAIEEVEAKVNDATAALAHLEATLSISTSRHEDAQVIFDREDSNVEVAKVEYETDKSALRQLLEPYISDLWQFEDDSSFSKVDLHLLDRANRYSDSRSKIHQLNEALSALRAEISHLEEAERISQERLATLTARQLEESKVAEELTNERRQLFAYRDPKVEEALAQRKVDDLGIKHQGLEVMLLESNDRISQFKGQITTLTSNLERLEAELRSSTEEVSARLSAEGFNDEGEFLGCLLSQIEVDELERRKDELTSTSLTLASQLQSQSESLARIEKLITTDDTLGEILEAIEDLEAQINQLQFDESALMARLEANERFRARYRALCEELAVQQRQFQRWEDLDKLIGSADGKKYRNFVQTLTFESLVKGANRQLQIMSDRYLLLADKRIGQRLSLNVVDNYQGGEVRTTKNLSGGESFIVSLALALGLSNMLSGRLSVDSLFLDEGFGTLDEEALEAAIDALSSLQSQGKVVGIISHVQSLKDRISTQITVAPTNGGRSVISGPGSKRLA